MALGTPPTTRSDPTTKLPRWLLCSTIEIVFAAAFAVATSARSSPLRSATTRAMAPLPTGIDVVFANIRGRGPSPGPPSRAPPAPPMPPAPPAPPIPPVPPDPGRGTESRLQVQPAAARTKAAPAPRAACRNRRPRIVPPFIITRRLTRWIGCGKLRRDGAVGFPTQVHQAGPPGRRVARKRRAVRVADPQIL